jgi:hypothetical protein
LASLLQLQAGWWGNGQGCYRPPVELAIPIVCIVSTRGEDKLRIVSDGEDLDLFQTCCPHNGDPKQPNTYQIRQNCPGPVCFTHDVALARDWVNCVKRKAERKVKELKDAGNITWDFTDDTMLAQCEYVNYEQLKEGIRFSDGSYPKSAAIVLGLDKWGLFFVAVMSLVGVLNGGL